MPPDLSKSETVEPAPVKPMRARREGGFALIAALAVLVVLGSTGAVMIRLSGVQQASTSLAVLGLRAEWAARAGIEWGLHQSQVAAGCPGASTSFNLSGGALSGFRVEVTCSETSHFEGAIEKVSISLRSEASFGSIGDRDFVFRDVRAAAVL